MMIRLQIIVVLVLALCCVSCQKSPTPAELVLERESGGVAPTAANVIKLNPPSNPAAIVGPAAGAGIEEVINVGRPSVWSHWLMLLAFILILFLLSVVLIHGMARRLRQKSFRAYAPTRHSDIWASHKPPEFLNP